MTGRLVLAPELPYARLAATLDGLGWEQVSGPALPPLVDGEPEFGSWRRPDGSTLVYTCNPVAWLRVLDLSAVDGPADRLALADALPQLDPARLHRLLRAGEAESVLLGVLAAEVLGAREELPAVRALMHHREPVLATAARRAVGRFTAAT